MKTDAFIGVFRTFPSGQWRVEFPDLPGCVVTADSLEAALLNAGQSLASHLGVLGSFSPRPRSFAELSEAAQSDWLLKRQFEDAIFFLVEPSEPSEEIHQWTAEAASSRAPGVLSARLP